MGLLEGKRRKPSHSVPEQKKKMARCLSRCLGAVLRMGDGRRREVGQRTHSVGNAISESHKLDLVLWAFPVGEKGQDEAEGGCLGVGGAVGEGNIAESGRDGVAILRVVGAHGWGLKIEKRREARQNGGRGARFKCRYRV